MLKRPTLFREETVATLVEEDYLNEERFAIQFAGGHFRLKQWGKVKIRYELKQRQVSDYCIKKALAAIDEEDYLKTLDRLAAAKWETLKGETSFARRGKLQEYLVRKGYEQDIIREAIRTLPWNLTKNGRPPMRNIFSSISIPATRLEDIITPAVRKQLEK